MKVQSDTRLHIAWRTIIPAFLLAFILMLAVQYQVPDLAGNDGYYHIKMAQVLWQENLNFQFTWLPLTILNPETYVDHHFLFHLLLIPFTGLGLLTGAKVATVVFAALAFCAIAVVLDTQNVRRPVLWMLMIFTLSNAFLYRMSMPRAQSLSLALLVIAVGLLLKQRFAWLMLLGSGYVWLFNGYPLLIIAAGLYTLALWITQQRFHWQPLAFSTSGIILGLVINPFFPKNLHFGLQHIAPKVLDPTIVQVGNEWYPYQTYNLMGNSGIALVLLIIGIAAWGLVQAKGERQTAILFSLLLVTLTGFMLFQSRRFIEYFPPFVLLFAALSIDTWLAENKHTKIFGEAGPVLGVVLILGMLLFAGLTLGNTSKDLKTSLPNSLFQNAAAWLTSHTPEGTLVFHSDWDEFPRLFFYNTHNRYITGLDPTYLVLADEELADLWEALVAGNIADPGEVIRGRYGANYILSDSEHILFIERCFDDPNLILVYQDQEALIFQNTGTLTPGQMQRFIPILSARNYD
jgi:hypothetical protein